MTDHDEQFIQDVAEALDDACIGGGAGIDAYELDRVSEHVTGLLADSGYRKPRTITTVDERQALDPLAVVMWIDDAGLPHAAVAAVVQAWRNTERHPMTVLWEPR